MLTSLHIQRYQGWHDQWCREVGAAFVKIVNPPENVDLLPSVPNVLVRFWSDDVAAGYIARGYEGGRAYVRDYIDRFRRVQARGKVLELWNEPDCNSNEGLRNLNNATLGAITEANAQGITLCVLNIAEGNPHDNGIGKASVAAWKWNELRSCIGAAVQTGHYLGRHCYWRPEVEGPTGRWHALGRLESDIDMLRNLGVDVDHLKVLVNEWGIDGGIAGHPPVQGWKVLTDPDTYRAQIVEGEAHARHIPQVQALMLFTSGYEGQWATYDHDAPFCGSLIQPLRALDSAPVTPPESASPRLHLPIKRADIARNADGSLRITQRFNPPAHYGIDYSCVVGKPVYAAIDGTAHCETQTKNGVMTGFGRYVRLEDGKGTYVYTAHLDAFAIYDRTQVHAGDLIGYSGNTGNSTGPHLHFEVRRGSRLQASAIDPEPLIVWPEPEVPEPSPQPTEPYLPTNDPLTLAAKTPQERYVKIRWWLEEADRQEQDNMPEYARAIRLALVEQMYTWEGEG